MQHLGTRFAKFSLSLFLCSSFLASQMVIIVDAAGGGDYTKIQTAVDLAKPGQLIRVRHGVYEGAGITRSVRLVGDPYEVLPSGEATYVELTSPIRIAVLPPGSSRVVADFSITPKSVLFNDDLVVARDCEGSIHVAFTHGGTLRFENFAGTRIAEGYQPKAIFCHWIEAY